MDRPAILVTGSSARIGAEIIWRFAAEGWHVVIHYGFSGDEAERLAAALPSAETIQCDLRDGDAAVAMIEELAARLNDWRVLINSASVFRPDDVTGLDSQTNIEAMQVNATTPARIAQAYLAEAQSQTGRCVINVTDQKLANPNPDFFSYTMSKHALSSTIDMLAMGAAGPEDRIYGLAPGAILPSHDQTEDEIDISHRLNPLKRKTEISEVADAAFLLASRVLRSGETIYVDSGQHILNQSRDVIYLARAMEQSS